MRLFSVLFGAEDPVACIAQAGYDVLVLIELFIQAGGIDLHIGMRFHQGIESFGSSNDAEEFDLVDALVL